MYSTSKNAFHYYWLICLHPVSWITHPAERPTLSTLRLIEFIGLSITVLWFLKSQSPLQSCHLPDQTSWSLCDPRVVCSRAALPFTALCRHAIPLYGACHVCSPLSCILQKEWCRCSTLCSPCNESHSHWHQAFTSLFVIVTILY